LMRDDHFVFADGTRVKFWGVNQGNFDAVPPKEESDVQAARFEKYGVNCVRLHKFVESVGHPQDSTKLTDEGWKNLDYHTAKLKQHGVYSGWSHLFMHRIKPGDKSRVLAYDEIVKGLDSNIYSLVNVAPDLQQLYIDLTVNMLRRRNPHTGLTYAQEPALAFIEFRNEDDIFWPSTQNAVEKCPTYKKRFNQYFSDWLQKKYGTQERLVAAWGPRALNAYPEFQKDESLAARNIYPIAHFWWYTPEGLKSQGDTKGTRLRLLDTARFLYEFQNDFYTRFARAIRATGYKGPLVGSCWQAGEGVPNWYNLHSDYLVGIIDRHNYFGGQTESWFLKPQTKIDNRSMLSQPGSGLLSTGMQMVKDRPFALSEWIHVTPSEWNAEGPALIAAYGMGLQGWDASYHFAINMPRFANTINEPRLWNVDTPTQIGLYPAVARMVHRGDVKEGAYVSTRKVHIPGLAQGRVGFEERVTQTGDVKSFSGDVPTEALAAGKVAVEFTAKPEPTLPIDLSRYTRGKAITSSTRQLQWDYTEAGKGFCTINTPGTKAVVGFAPNRNFALGAVGMRIDNPFAVVFVTSLEKGRAISASNRLLVTAVARAHNTGMRWSTDRTMVEEVGQAPILMEPVRATVTLGRRTISAVNILDHDGRRTGRTLPVQNGRISIDGARDKTLYYEIVLR
ncbi:MAG TPA: hypothetical protein VM821_04990, partial [Abditibacteriaceae bacterium]|nr:hypothetical protein [Abditibacteriaceae bacterium]